MNKRFSGVVVPMITPLNDDFTVDVEAVKRIIHLFSKYNIHPLVLGTTGESTSINDTESLRLVEAANSAKQANQCLYVGLLGNQVNDLILRGNSYINAGADCVVATLPSYYLLNNDQMILFYETLANKLSGPLMVYNITATTHMSIPLEVIEKLAQHNNIWGLKDSERDANRMQTLINTYKHTKEFSYFCGWGAKSFESLQFGADGIVPSTGNYVPDMYFKLYEAAKQNQWDVVEHWQSETDNVARLYQKDKTLGESLAVLKALMNEKNLCNKTMMPPLTAIS